MSYMDYSLYLNIINAEIEKKNSEKSDLTNTSSDVNIAPLSVGLPSHLKI